jgi:hypothetical protein
MPPPASHIENPNGWCSRPLGPPRLLTDGHVERDDELGIGPVAREDAYEGLYPLITGRRVWSAWEVPRFGFHWAVAA